MPAVVIRKATILKKIVTILNNKFTSLSIQIVEDLLRILMVTTCKFMLFDISIELEEGLPQGESLAFSVNAKHFLESFDAIRTNDAVRFDIDAEQLNIEILSKGVIDRTSLRISPTQSLSLADEFEYENAIDAEDLNFQKACKSFNKVNSNELIVRGNSRRISMRASLDGIYTKEIEIGDVDAKEDEFETVYQTEHFMSISKISTLNDHLLFYAQEGQPLCIEARFGDKGVFRVFIQSEVEEAE